MIGIGAICTARFSAHSLNESAQDLGIDAVWSTDYSCLLKQALRDLSTWEYRKSWDDPYLTDYPHGWCEGCGYGFKADDIYCKYCA